MNTIKYVFETRKPELQKLVVKYGVPPAVNEQDLWRKTNFLVTKFRENFMKDIADIHPDKGLFAWRFSLEKPKVSEAELENIANNTTVQTEQSSNCCGSGANGEKTSGCCGSGANGEKTSGCCGSGANGEKTSGCNGNKECSCNKSNITGAEIKEKVKDNMPIVIIASLALVVGVIALSQRRFS